MFLVWFYIESEISDVSVNRITFISRLFCFRVVFAKCVI